MAAAAEPPAARHTAGPLERFIVPAMSALRNLKPRDRPGTKEKLASWLKLRGFCVVREDNVVAMHLLIPEVSKILGAGPVSSALELHAGGVRWSGDPVEAGALPAEVFAESAARCASRLRNQADFLKWSIDRRDKFLKTQAYARFRVEPQALIAELERLGAAKEGRFFSTDGLLTYDEDVLAAPVEADASAPPNVIPMAAAAMCKTFLVPHLISLRRHAYMTKKDWYWFKSWLKVLGCELSPTDTPGTYQVTVRALSARSSTSMAAAQELERTVEKELPEVLKYMLCDPNGPPDSRAVDPQVVIDRRGRSYVVGRAGCNIMELENKYEVRLTYTSKFVGWLSTSLLPRDGTAEGLRGLGERLRQHAKRAEAGIVSHIGRVVEQCSVDDEVYRKERAIRRDQRGIDADAWYQEPVGAARLYRDHDRETDARKKAQRKQALLARDSRQQHWKKRRDHMDQQHGGRHKAGEGHVGPEDRADAGQGGSGGGVAEDLRPEWEDPNGPAFTSQLDAPKVLGTKPRHRGHKPGSARVPGSWDGGLGADASDEEDE